MKPVDLGIPGAGIHKDVTVSSTTLLEGPLLGQNYKLWHQQSWAAEIA